MVEVRCPNCNSSFALGNGGSPIAELKDGIHYLVPETIRNENKTSSRLEILKAAGVNIEKLQTLMEGNSSFKDIFEEDDPILKELSSGGFIRNNELFRRWITAQTFALLRDPKGWTHAVRRRYNLRYIFRQTLNELTLLCKLERKGLKGKDRRFSFFTLEDLKAIFIDLSKRGDYRFERENAKQEVTACTTYKELLSVINRYRWSFPSRCTYKPARWLNCFKGAGAYYTLQNIIRTHGLVLPKCKDMNESLEWVENTYNDIIGYKPHYRRWDILMSVLVSAVHETHFELKY